MGIKKALEKLAEKSKRESKQMIKGIEAQKDLKYMIPEVRIKGVNFTLNHRLSLEQVLLLGREFESRGYDYHIEEQVAYNKYECRTLRELEQLLNSKYNKGYFGI